MKEQNQFLMQRIEALENENKRLNEELRTVKNCAFKVRLSDENFNKPLSEIEVDYSIVKSN